MSGSTNVDLSAFLPTELLTQILDQALDFADLSKAMSADESCEAYAMMSTRQTDLVNIMLVSKVSEDLVRITDITDICSDSIPFWKSSFVPRQSFTILAHSCLHSRRDLSDGEIVPLST